MFFLLNNQLIPTEKYDAMVSYKKANDYFLRIASVDYSTVYIENKVCRYTSELLFYRNDGSIKVRNSYSC